MRCRFSSFGEARWNGFDFDCEATGPVSDVEKQSCDSEDPESGVESTVLLVTAPPWRLAALLIDCHFVVSSRVLSSFTSVLVADFGRRSWY
jgi:hypothetical protein